ncbi:hypothetical protein ABIF26_008235, partial [Bradyrhizobium elkanii]|uniref:hypothetical protein n=1 Tax=Bradyrhizobium elkanii TaxID=29448 RepID=UPI0035126F24
AAFDAIAPTTTRGDLIFRNATTNARLAAGTAGYLLQTNGAGADPSWAGFLQSGTGAATRTWNGKVSDIVTPEDFGAVGDGVADDTTALTNALATGKTVYASKTYKTTATIAVTNTKVTLFGGGTILKTAGANDALSISNTDFTQPVYIDGLKIITTQQEAGAAIVIQFPEADTSNILQHRCTLRDVEVRGQDVGSHGFLGGYKLTNVHRPTVINCHASGRQSGTGPAALTHMDYGFYIHVTGTAAVTDPVFVSCKVFASNDGWRGDGHIEGVSVQQCLAVAVNNGFNFSLSAQWPWFSANDCHVAAFNTGFNLQNFAQSFITNNLVYRREDATGNVVGVFMSACDNSRVIGNHFVDAIGAVGGLLFGVQVNNSNRVAVAFNQVSGANIGVAITGTSDFCETRNTIFDNSRGGGPLTYSMTSSGTNNIRRGQILDVSARNSGGAVSVSGGAAVNVTSVSTDALEVGDDIEVFFVMQCDKDANAGHCLAIVVKSSGTATIVFDDASTDMRVEAFSSASQTIYMRGTARAKVTGRGTCTLTLQGFSPTNAFTVPVSGGQINVRRA